MKKEELIRRIDKKKDDIAKIERRIAKWENGMPKEIKEAIEPYVGLGYPQFNLFRMEHRDDPKCYGSDWSKGPNIDEAYRARVDLMEAKDTLAKYEKSLKDAEDFANEGKVEAIWSFLMEWKENAKEFYRRNAKELFELRKGFASALAKFKEENPDADWRKRKDFERDYMSSVEPLTYEITSIRFAEKKSDLPWKSERYPASYSVDENALEDALGKEAERKYKDIVKRVKEKAGDVLDASGLHIGAKGTIDGVIVGSKRKVRVETIYAGGYNVQCLHCRVLIHEVKGK